MTRPIKPSILSHKDRKTHLETKIVEHENLYVVLYNFDTFTISTEKKGTSNIYTRYHTPVYATENVAQKRADNLNKMFTTDKFTVDEIKRPCFDYYIITVENTQRRTK